MPRMTFHGGVHPQPRKLMTWNLPITRAPLPEKAVFALEHTSEFHCRPLVGIGDRVRTGQPIAESGKPATFFWHASISGKISSIGPCPDASGRNVRSITIESDGLDLWHGRPSIPGDLSALSASELLTRIRDAGVAGTGNSVRPLILKLSRTMNPKSGVVLLNGMESEPFLAAEHRLLVENTAEVLAGLRIWMQILGVRRAKIAVPREDREAIRKLRGALRRSKTVSVVPLENKYPMGGEFQLIEALTGLKASSAASGGDSGVFTETVSTAFATAEAALSGRPVIDRVVTLSGDGVRETRNLKARIGTPIHELISWCGGFTSDRIRLIHGGPMSGPSIHSDRIPVTKTTSGILAFAATSFPAFAEKPCISCGRCWDCCPMRLHPRKIEHWILHDGLERALSSGLEACILCGSCGYVCPSKRQLTSRFEKAKSGGFVKKNGRIRQESE
jgi:Na+-translocating ferredoxin:NAD+ oxidoreductase subunit C